MRNSQRVLEVKNWTDGISLTNIGTNTDFSNGTAGWSSTASISVAGGILSALFTPNDSVKQTISVISGHKYYIASRVKSPYNTVYAALGDGLTAQLTASHSGSNQYELLSAVITANQTSSAGQIQCVRDYYAGTKQTVYVDYCICIDLTAHFPASLEPTATQMLTIAPTWFSGTQNCTLAGYTRTIDRSRSQLHGTLSGGAAYKYISGMPLHVLDFTSSTSLCTIPKNAAINDMAQFSFAAWVWYGGAGGNNVGMLFSKNVTRYLHIDFVLNRLRFVQYCSTAFGGWVTPTNGITTGNYYHVIMTYNSASTSNHPVIYIDGALVTVTRINTPVGTLLSDAAGDLILGNAIQPGFDYFLNGYLSEITLTRGIMTAAEVKRLYNSQCLKYPGKVMIP